MEAEETEKKKIEQLTDAVTRLGSDSQKERWAAHVMPRSEILDLLWAEWIKPVAELPLLATKCGPHFEGAWESDKQTLSDNEWDDAKHLYDLFPGATITYHHQYDQYELSINHPRVCDLIRLMQHIGMYDFGADVIIGGISLTDEA